MKERDFSCLTFCIRGNQSVKTTGSDIIVSLQTNCDEIDLSKSDKKARISTANNSYYWKRYSSVITLFLWNWLHKSGTSRKIDYCSLLVVSPGWPLAIRLASCVLWPQQLHGNLAPGSLHAGSKSLDLWLPNPNRRFGGWFVDHLAMLVSQRMMYITG